MITKRDRVSDMIRTFVNSFKRRRRSDGSVVTVIIDGAPDWVHEVVRLAHDGAMPDDAIFAAIATMADDILCDALIPTADDVRRINVYDWADGMTDAYTADLVRWLGAAGAVAHVDGVLSDYSVCTLEAALRFAQRRWYEAIARRVLDALADAAEKEEQKMTETETEIRIEAGAPYRVAGWGRTSDGDAAGYVHWPVSVRVEDASVEVDCWTLVGRASGHADLDRSALAPDCRGQWRQLPTDGAESGMPRIRSIRIAPGTIDAGDEIDDVVDVVVEIGAGHAGPCEILPTTLRGLRALLERVDEDHNIVVTPPNCSEAVCESLPHDDD